MNFAEGRHGSDGKSTTSKKKKKKVFDLRDTIKTIVVKMEREKREDHMKKIPDGFISFTHDNLYVEMLQNMHEYMTELFRLENRGDALAKEAKDKGLPVPSVLPSEKKKLYAKAKLVADKYSWIVFRHKSLGH